MRTKIALVLLTAEVRRVEKVSRMLLERRQKICVLNKQINK